MEKEIDANKELPVKWYHRPVAVIIAILCVGPFALPMVWASRAFKRGHKIIITAVVLVITVWLISASVKLYKLLLTEMQDLRNILEQLQ